MIIPSADPPDLHSEYRFAPASVIVTPDRGTARQLQSRGIREQARLGHVTHPPLAVLEFQHWLEQVWQKAARVDTHVQACLLLSQAQEFTLWQSIIDQDLKDNSADSALIDTAQLARQAMSSHALKLQWRIPGGAAFSEDAKAFERWLGKLKTICGARGYLPRGELETRVMGLVQQYPELARDSLVFFGFTELSPGREALFQTLAKQRGAICFSPLRAGRSALARCYASGADELQAITDWVADGLTEDPGASIGIVYPGTDAQRYRLRHALEARLETCDPPQPGPVELRPGPRLLDFPLAQHALLLLETNVRRSISFNDTIKLLYSPWIGRADWPLGERIRLEQSLRQAGFLKLIPTAPRRLGINKDSGAERFFNSLFQRFDTRAQQFRWSEAFSSALNNAGWPGTRTDQTSADLSTQFTRLLSSLDDCNLIRPATDANVTLKRLQHLLGSVPARQPGLSACVTVLADEDICGQTFSRLWVAGGSASRWPGTSEVDPFLSPAAQRSACMPGANADDLRNRRLLTLKRMQFQCDEIRFSSLPDESDGMPEPAPLIESLATWTTATTAATAEAVTALALEQLADPAGPSHEQTRVRGGISVLADQSDCPFRAFARHRLGAAAPEEPGAGEDPRVRGIFMHAVLEAFWKRVGDHAGLVALDPGQRRSLLGELTETTLTRLRRHSDTGFGRRFDRLEAGTAVEILMRLLDLEEARPDFRVGSTEADVLLEIGGLEFALRIDRIDQLADGSRLLIDYKTGQASLPDWSEKRLPEPQLPAYALSAEDQNLALALATVHPKKISFTGVAPAEVDIKGINTWNKNARLKSFDTWPEVLAQWQQSLEQLATEFRQGWATVTPRNGVCSYCDLKGFCRVNLSGDPESETEAELVS